MLKVGGIEAVVLRRAVKNLHLNVLPPVGRVRITAPERMTDDAISVFMATRISWIKKQQAKFQSQERQTPREYVSGETHYFLGKKYRLEVVSSDDKPNVAVKGKSKLVLTVQSSSELVARERIVQNWYRRELRTLLTQLVEKWGAIIGTKPSRWGIKRMKTRWGTCNHDSGSIWFNLELAKKPVSCIEYVIVHELIHLIEKKHGPKFIALLNRYYPKWQSEKEELNSMILAHETWKDL